MATQLQTQGQKAPATIKDMILGTQFKDAVAQALPSHLKPERFIRVALTALMRTPELAECTRESLFKCLLDLSRLGLEPDGRCAHLIPYKNNKQGTREAQLIIDYKGMIELSKRSGEVKSWRAELVCEKDFFAWENGIINHKIDWLAPRGKVLAVYSHVCSSSGIDDYEVMTLEEIEAIKKRSKTSNFGPWVTDYNEMAKKTVMRRHSKRLTLSPEFTDALHVDADKIDYQAPTVDLKELMPKRASEALQAQEDVQIQEERPIKGDPMWDMDDVPPFEPETQPPLENDLSASIAAAQAAAQRAQEGVPPLNPNVISEPQRKRLMAIIGKKCTPDEVKTILMSNWGFASSKEITKAEYEKVCSYFENLGTK